MQANVGLSVDSQITHGVAYKKLTDKSYELCADFKRSNSNDEKNNMYHSGYNEEWKHDKGNVCFSREVENVKAKSLSNNLIVDDTKTSNDYLNSMEESRNKARIASIKSAMSNIIPSAIVCVDGGGKILGGNSGDKLCSNQESATWSTVSLCGSSKEDTKWIVVNSDNENWDFTLSCKNFTDCNGPGNAICNSKGCTFAGTCQ